MGAIRAAAGRGKDEGGNGMTISAGETWRLKFDPNPVTSLMHIRAVVDESHIVYREWSRRKKRWNYQIGSIEQFDMYFREGCLKKVKG